MKTEKILLFCLIMGFAMSQTYAQDKDTKSVQYKANLGYYTPVYCVDDLTGEAVMVNYLQGVVKFHVIDHYKNGIWQWEIAQAKGEAEGYYGEVFTITETDRYWIPEFGILTWHYNAKGNMGNHYIGYLTYSYLTGEITVGKTVCH